MACFTVPLAEAVIVTTVRKTVLKNSAVNAVHSAKMDSINRVSGAWKRCSTVEVFCWQLNTCGTEKFRFFRRS